MGIAIKAVVTKEKIVSLIRFFTRLFKNYPIRETKKKSPFRVFIIVLFVSFCFLISTVIEDIPLRKFRAHVTNVYDGDTIHVELLSPVVNNNRLVAYFQNLFPIEIDEKKFKIRIYGIDCPESKQDHGLVAATALRSRIDNRNIDILINGQDKYRRYVGSIFYQGSNIGLDMIRMGHCRWYSMYSNDIEYQDAEIYAKERKLNIWSDPNAVPPWEYRRRERNKTKNN